MPDINYWRELFKRTQVPFDFELEEREKRRQAIQNQKEWNDYWKEQGELAIKHGLLTKEEAEKL